MTPAPRLPTSPRHVPPAPTSPVPEPIREAIAAVVRDMRNMPRELIGDPAEVVHFLARQARRLDGIRAMRVPAALPPPPKPPSAVLMATIGAASARAAAEAAFTVPAAPMPAPNPAARPAPASRLVVGRRGRPVPIVLRQARAAGQIELPL